MSILLHLYCSLSDIILSINIAFFCYSIFDKVTLFFSYFQFNYTSRSIHQDSVHELVYVNHKAGYPMELAFIYPWKGTYIITRLSCRHMSTKWMLNVKAKRNSKILQQELKWNEITDRSKRPYIRFQKSCSNFTGRQRFYYWIKTSVY